MKSKARFSKDRKYRYMLERQWNDVPKPKTVLFVCLNPSTADETLDDPTIRRCINFAKDWGYDRLWVVNVFAYRSTDPKGLLEVEDPIGLKNDQWIKRLSRRAHKTIIAWGSNKLVTYERRSVVYSILQSMYNLGINKNGSPKHPLYLRKNAIPKLHPIIFTGAKARLFINGKEIGEITGIKWDRQFPTENQVLGPIEFKGVKDEDQS